MSQVISKVDSAAHQKWLLMQGAEAMGFMSTKKRSLENRCVAGTKVKSEFSPGEFREATILRVNIGDGGAIEYSLRWEHDITLCTDMLDTTYTALQSQNCLRAASRSYPAYGRGTDIRCDGIVPDISVPEKSLVTASGDSIPGAAIIALVTFGLVFLIFWSVGRTVSASTRASGAGTDGRSHPTVLKTDARRSNSFNERAVLRYHADRVLGSNSAPIWEDDNPFAGRGSNRSSKIAPEPIRTTSLPAHTSCGINFVTSPTTGSLRAQTGLTPTHEEKVARQSRTQQMSARDQQKRQQSSVNYIRMMQDQDREFNSAGRGTVGEDLRVVDLTPHVSRQGSKTKSVPSTAPGSVDTSRAASKERR